MMGIKDILYATIQYCSIKNLKKLIEVEPSMEVLVLQFITKDELRYGFSHESDPSKLISLQNQLREIYKTHFGDTIPPLENPILISYLIKDHIFDVLQRYEIQYIKPLGEGSYGTICTAWDKEEKAMVAIKKNRNVFSFDTWYQKRIYRELRILRHLDHENIINLIDLIPPKSYEEFTDVYLVTEKMETDLRRIIDSDQEITEEHVQYFLHQILCGLQYIHSANILHRDLKPENILINSDCSVKICDFGLSRSFDFENDNPVMSTPYVATRWYRAPELLLQSRNADRGMDIWSVGCIFAELLLRKPFFPGKNYLDQLNLIIKVLGTPNISNISCETSAKQYMETLPFVQRRSFHEIFKNVSMEAIDLLEKMLTFDPSKRITIEQALDHPYLKELGGSESEENICPKIFNFGNENDTTDIKRLIYDEIMEWNAIENCLGGDALKFPSCPKLRCYRLSHFNNQTVILLPHRYHIPSTPTIESKLVYRKENSHLLLVGVDNIYERPVVVHHYPNGALWEDNCKNIILTILTLQHIGGHNNILSLVDIAPPVSLSQFRDVVIVTEFLEYTLQTLLKSNYTFKDNTILVVIYQICLGVLYAHSASIAHCNLCPSAVYIDKNLNVKLSNFGVYSGSPNSNVYIYKAPEIILEYAESNEAADVWSIGCLLAQMYNNNQPLFSGLSVEQLIESHLQVLGPPSIKELPENTPVNIVQFFVSIQDLSPQYSLHNILANIPEDARDLITRLLVWNPKARPSLEEIVKHRYFSKFSHLRKTLHKSKFELKLPSTSHRKILYNLIMTTAQKQNGYVGDAIVENQVVELPHIIDDQ